MRLQLSSSSSFGSSGVAQAVASPKIGRSVSKQSAAYDSENPIPGRINAKLPCHGRFKRVLEWYPTKLTFAFSIFAYAVLLGVEVEKNRLLKTEAQVKLLERVDMMLTFVFVMEILLKLYVYGHGFVLINRNVKTPDYYHLTDVIITAASILHVLLVNTKTGREYKATVQFLKTFRMARLFRLFTLKRELRIIIDGFMRSILSLFWVFIVLLVITYGCTVFCATMIGTKTYPPDYGFDNKELFGTIPRCMLTLFSMLILSEWDSVVRPVMDVQPPLVLFFIGFTILVTFGMMNVVVGIIVDTVASVRKQNDDRRKDIEKKTQMERFECLMAETVKNLSAEDTIGEPCFTEEEFVSCADQLPELTNLMNEIDFPHGFTLGDLYVMLDNSGDNMVVESEFVSGMSQLVFGNEFQRACMLQLSLHRLHKLVVREITEIKADLGRVHKRADKLEDDVKSTRDRVEQGAPSASRDQPLQDSRVNRFISNTQKSMDTMEEAFDALRSATLEHCRREVAKAQEELDASANVQRSEVQVGLSPGYWAPDATCFSRPEESFLVRAKLLDAVQDASVEELRRWLYHAVNIGIAQSGLSLEMAYTDKLVKDRQGPWASSQRVVNALDRGEWNSACDFFIEMCQVRSSGSDTLNHVTSQVRMLRNPSDSIQKAIGEHHQLTPMSRETPPAGQPLANHGDRNHRLTAVSFEDQSMPSGVRSSSSSRRQVLKDI